MAVQGLTPKQRGSYRHILFLAVVAVILLTVCYAWGALNWSYSDGERAGTLQKFSHRGWLCKTYEGELALYVVAGVQPEVWDFSVRDESLARQLASAVGERVQLHYTEHRGVPSSCFGDTGYYVDRINAVGTVVPTTPSAAH